MKLSVIIPVLNEEASVLDCLSRLQGLRQTGHEVIVVDGGSVDQTCALSSTLSDHVLLSPPGRARQMNAGAAHASGDMLLFLHADTSLPDAADVVFEQAGLSAMPNYWGRFDMRLDADGVMFRVIETMMNLRSRLTSVATGDQSIFVERQLFEAVGGYEDIPLMEDVALCKALRRRARPVNLKYRVTSSARRWQKQGIARTIVLMWKLRLYYFLGVSPHRLVAMYR